MRTDVVTTLDVLALRDGSWRRLGAGSRSQRGTTLTVCSAHSHALSLKTSHLHKPDGDRLKWYSEPIISNSSPFAPP
eukprot:855783-Rhodomonas_salina.1